MNIKTAYRLSLDSSMVRLEFEGSKDITIIDSTSPPDWYLLWVEEGNEPLPPDPIPEPEPLTPQQKLEASGLTVEELKELLGL